MLNRCNAVSYFKIFITIIKCLYPNQNEDNNNDDQTTYDDDSFNDNKKPTTIHIDFFTRYSIDFD